VYESLARAESERVVVCVPGLGLNTRVTLWVGVPVSETEAVGRKVGVNVRV